MDRQMDSSIEIDDSDIQRQLDADRKIQRDRYKREMIKR